MEEHFEQVNLMEFADAKLKAPKADKPITVSKKELERRRKIRPGHVEFYGPGQAPEFKKKVVRKRQCPFCGFHNGRLMAVCPRCHNCMACGSFTTESRSENCPICGNYNSTLPPPKRIINVN